MAAPCFDPSPYTAALLQQLRRRAARLAGATVLDMGTGSGVLLAAMLQAGARAGTGVDLEPAAVAAAQALLRDAAVDDRAEVLQGDLWAPCAGRRFDVIATNLPQYPLYGPLEEDRLPSWSYGGVDGRVLVDRFLQGLPVHLVPGGFALMTHNRFIDVDRTQALLRRLGLRGEVACTVCVSLSAQRVAALPAAAWRAHGGDGLLRVGRQGFAEFHVLEITGDAPAG